MKIRIRLNESKNKKEELYDLEKVHFGGDLRDIAQSLKFLVDNNKSEFGDIDTYAIDQIIKDAGGTNIKYAGEGAFRITYSHGDEEVIKIAKTNSAKIMNEQDTELGRNTKYASLFPKVYMADEPKYDWIVMEKCKPIIDSDTFMEFFPNPLVEEFFGDTSNFVKARIFQLFLDYEANLIMDEDTNLYDAKDKLQHYMKREDYSKPKRQLTDGMIHRILKEYNETFHLLAEMVAEFKISTVEIRVYNTGIAPDGRFVVIDSSIAATISAGLASVP